MEKLISRFTTFNISLLLGAYFLYAFQFEPGGTALGIRRSGPIPAIILSISPWLIVADLWLCLKFTKELDGRNIIFPRIWANDFESTRLSIFWEKASIGLTIFPQVLALFYFWSRFPKGKAWNRNGVEVQLWEYVSPVFFFDWNAHSYGSNLENAASYLPFWQPLIMASGTVIVTVITIKILGQMPERFIARKTALYR